MSARLGLSLASEPDLLAAALPLLAAGQVEVLEWSFDTAWDVAAQNPALDELLDHFAQAGALLGHGVTLSVLSVPWAPRQQKWLERLAAECARRPYRHLSEHFGFMTTPQTSQGAPLPVPYTVEAVQVGRDRLARLADVSRCPVGLENLAFAFTTSDVERQGAFLEDLLSPGDGFLVLDAHNLYCQVVNFEQDPVALLRSYPLHRVRELHVSGGSWSEHPGRKVRRDTHDGAVPSEVMDMVCILLDHCAGVEAVILERLGGTLGIPAAVAQFHADFGELASRVRGPRSTGCRTAELPRQPISEVEGLAGFQQAVLDSLFRESTPGAIRACWCEDPALQQWLPYLNTCEDRMIAIAAELVKKWGVRERGPTATALP